MNYYSAIIFLCWLALAVLGVLVRENDRLSREEKRLFYLTPVVVALSALAEWLGLRFSGNPDIPTWALRTVKCLDYILTPAAGGALVAQLRTRSIWQKMIVGLIVINAAFQLLCVYTGWMLTIDEQNCYSHGPLYIVYMILYLFLISLVIADFVAYGRLFRRQNRISLYAILFLVVAGIMIQELLGGEFRTAYLAMTLGISLMFIHVTEFSQLAADDAIHMQQELIETDTLTGVASRFAYSRTLSELDAAGALPPELLAFSIDVNGLKTVNDTLGHEAGDELLCGAAGCIMHVLGGWGKCFRTGGDEFIVLARMQKERAGRALKELMEEASNWRGRKVDKLHMAIGYASAADHPGLSAEKLVGAADVSMYRAKAEYYRTEGIDRRHQ